MDRPRWLAPFDPTGIGVDNPRGQDAVSVTHHLWPLAAGGPDVDENRCRLRPNLHADAHALMGEFTRRGGPNNTPPTVVSRFSKRAQDLARYAWEATPPENRNHLRDEIIPRSNP